MAVHRDGHGRSKDLGQDGFTFLEAVVGIALLSMLAVIFSKFSMQQASATHFNQIEIEKTMIKKMVEENISCKDVLSSAANACTAPYPYLELHRKGSTTAVAMTDPLETTGVLEGSGRFFGNWYVRTQCGSNGLEVSVAKASQTGEFFEHPLKKGVKLDWNNPGSQIISEDLLCINQIKQAVASEGIVYVEDLTPTDDEVEIPPTCTGLGCLDSTSFSYSSPADGLVELFVTGSYDMGHTRCEIHFNRSINGTALPDLPANIKINTPESEWVRFINTIYLHTEVQKNDLLEIDLELSRPGLPWHSQHCYLRNIRVYARIYPQ